MVTPVNETLIAIQSLDVVCVCNGSVVKNAGKNVIKKKRRAGMGCTVLDCWTQKLNKRSNVAQPV